MLLLYTVNQYFLLYIFFNFPMHFQKNICAIIYLYVIFSMLVRKQTNKQQTINGNFLLIIRNLRNRYLKKKSNSEVGKCPSLHFLNVAHATTSQFSVLLKTIALCG